MATETAVNSSPCLIYSQTIIRATYKKKKKKRELWCASFTTCPHVHTNALSQSWYSTLLLLQGPLCLSLQPDKALVVFSNRSSTGSSATYSRKLLGNHFHHHLFLKWVFTLQPTSGPLSQRCFFFVIIYMSKNTNTKTHCEDAMVHDSYILYNVEHELIHTIWVLYMHVVCDSRWHHTSAITEICPLFQEVIHTASKLSMHCAKHGTFSPARCGRFSSVYPPVSHCVVLASQGRMNTVPSKQFTPQLPSN